MNSKRQTQSRGFSFAAWRINNVLTPERSTQDFRVEALLVFADLRRVAVRPDVGRVDVDHGDLPGFVQPGLLLLLLQQLIRK